MTYSRIVGTGRYLPERIMTNFDLEKIVDTTDEWIRTRTGVERRHVVAEDQTTSDMCVEAAKIAIEDAGVDVSEIDLVITGTTSPDLIFPNISTLIQHRLGIPACPAFSLEAACTGFIYALTMADKFIRLGDAKCALIMGAECITKFVDWTDRNTCVLFGDGAGAVIVKPSQEPGLISCHLGADGQYKDLLYYPVGPSKHLEKAGTDEAAIMMTGSEVFKVAVKTLGGIADGDARESRRQTKRTRLADSSPGEYSHYPGHGQAPGPADGQGHSDRAGPRQHVGRVGTYGARCRYS